MAIARRVTQQSSPQKVHKASAIYKPTAASQDHFWSLVKQYLPLVKSIVARMRIYFPTNIDSDDISSIALTGLIHAAKNFNPTTPNTFPSYAKIRIRGALLDELRKIDHLSRSNRADTKKFKQQIAQLEQTLGYEPTKIQVCLNFNISSANYDSLINNKNPIFKSLDSPLNHNSKLSVNELISDPSELNPFDLADKKDLMLALNQSITQLDLQSQKILSLYYVHELRLAEIAHIFNLTESRICQLHSKAISSLRTLLDKKMLK